MFVTIAGKHKCPTITRCLLSVYCRRSIAAINRRTGFSRICRKTISYGWLGCEWVFHHQFIDVEPKKKVNWCGSQIYIDKPIFVFGRWNHFFAIYIQDGGVINVRTNIQWSKTRVIYICLRRKKITPINITNQISWMQEVVAYYVNTCHYKMLST